MVIVRYSITKIILFVIQIIYTATFLFLHRQIEDLHRQIPDYWERERGTGTGAGNGIFFESENSKI